MIDLHTHTNHSDGTDSVEEILKNAEKNNIEILSITDHDSVDAYFELERNPNLRQLFSGKLITGAELKTFYNKVSIEILAYGIDYKKIRIHKYDASKLQNEILEKYGAVSEECAEAMANGLYERTGCDLALCTTGIAGPTGGTEVKPVGLVYISTRYKGIVTIKEIKLNPDIPRIEMKEKFAQQALKLAISTLAGNKLC